MTPEEVLRRRRGNGSLVAVMPEPRPRGESGPDSLQLVRRGDRLYVRRAPSSIENPSRAQIEQRIAFGKAAKATAGIRDARERALRISEALKGTRSEFTAPEPLPPWAAELIRRGYDRRLVEEAVRAWAGR